MTKITAVLMIEILGRPADYIKQALAEIIDNLGKAKDVIIKERKIAEPKELETGVFTTFAEVEIETTLNSLMLVVFDFMPSHIEIITPEELSISNSDFNMFFNELARKLHQYDELAKTIMMERNILINQLKQIKENPELLKRIKEAQENSPAPKIEEILASPDTEDTDDSEDIEDDDEIEIDEKPQEETEKPNKKKKK